MSRILQGYIVCHFVAFKRAQFMKITHKTFLFVMCLIIKTGMAKIVWLYWVLTITLGHYNNTRHFLEKYMMPREKFAKYKGFV